MRTLTPMHRARAQRRAAHRNAVALALGTTLLTPVAQAQTWQTGVRLGGSTERLPIELSATRFVSGTTLPETEITYALRLRAFGEVSGRPVDALGLTFGLDSGLFEVSEPGVQLDRRPFEQQLQNTLLLGRVSAELQLGESGVVAIRAGRYQPRVGDGAVFDAYAFGAEVDVDLDLVDGPPLSFNARVLLPDGTFTSLRKTSPLIDFEVGYRLGLFSRITLMASIFIDTRNELSDPVRASLFKGLDDAFSDLIDALAAFLRVDRDVAADALLTSINNNTAVETEGVLTWSGLSGQFGDDRFFVRITFLAALGQLDVRTVPIEGATGNFLGRTLPDGLQSSINDSSGTSADVKLQAFFGEVQSTLYLTDDLKVGTFALVLTGDQGIRLGESDPTLGAFIGLSPLLPRTAVFFGGTFGPDQATPTAFGLAPDGSGIIAGGAHVAVYRPTWSARIDGAAMAAMEASRFTGGQFYGFEVDAHAEVTIFDPVAAFVDGGVLFPGDFFDDHRPALQVVAGLQLFLQSDE